MLSKARIKFVKSLQLKKYRKQEQCFVVQGAKSVQELLDSDFEVVTLFGTADFLQHRALPGGLEVIGVSDAELAAISEFQTNDAALAVARMKPNNPLRLPADAWALALDDIRDPGNLGTIIRTADWFGLSHIVASEETADVYNAKVISATMGSFTRVEIFYTDLVAYMATVDRPVYGTFLEGSDVHSTSFGRGGFVLIGNEARGISPALERFVTQKITIPRYGRAESLNAAVATAVVLDNVVRRG